MIFRSLTWASLLLGFSVSAHVPMGDYQYKPILTDVATIRALGLPLLASESRSGVGYTVITPEQEQKISQISHQMGKCAGFESLDDQQRTLTLFDELKELGDLVEKEQHSASLKIRAIPVQRRQEIVEQISKVDAESLKAWVTWLSSYDSRDARQQDPNIHVEALKMRLENMTSVFSDFATVDLVEHRSTKQKSLRVRLLGKARPQEIVVLGGHLDSVNSKDGGRAPGADDNASGSSNLIQALSLVLEKGQPERTLEFFWYAGEEQGLLGSAEIAKSYHQDRKDVVGVLQLDMTLFPGSGAMVIGSMTDFTSAWLRDYLEELNRHYLNAKIIYDSCGYGCSDHASWFRQGFPTLMPFESNSGNMNSKIHSRKDIIDARLNFEHSALFTKVAVAFAMDLGNSSLRP
ncbi:MAG: M28 family peptidase [Proteobacteria bacterium]|nr:M28 family peptidase [Pseudomonadota bacterium]